MEKLRNQQLNIEGKIVLRNFVKISEAKRLYRSYPEVPMLPLSKSQLKKHKKTTKCHICFKEFGEKGKVRDHCHYTGIYRRAAHFG